MSNIDSLRAQGYEIDYLHPSKETKQLPRYPQWKEFISTRPDHSVVIDGEVKSICVCCGIQFPYVPMRTKGGDKIYKIRVGCMVQMSQEDIDCLNRTCTVRTVRRPATKVGLGCPDCQTLYQKEVEKTEKENRIREELNTLRAQYAALTKGKAETMSMLVPWIDMKSYVVGEM